MVLITFVLLQATPASTSETVIFDRILSDHSIGFDILHVLSQAIHENKSIIMDLNADNPLMYRIKKCGRVLLFTHDAVKEQQVIFGTDWIAWMFTLSGKKCSEYEVTNQLYLDVLTDKLTSGVVTFQVVEHSSITRMENSLYQNNIPYYLNSSAHETNVFISTLTPLIPKVLSSNFLNIHLICDLTSPAKIQFSKCGLVVSNPLYVRGVESVVLKNSDLESISRVSQLQCTSDFSQSRFEIRVTTFNRAGGAFALKIVDDTTVAEEAFYIGLVALGFMFLVACCCCVCTCTNSCCFKKKRVLTNEYLETFAMKPLDDRCDTCGESVDAPHHAK
ncbi:unnamed protein product [Caenorhabditis brenneri]